MARTSLNPVERLAPKQAKFVEEYLVDLNGKQAALRAGYSPKTAEVQASQLLRNLKVHAAITEAQAARARRVHLTQDAVLQEIALLQHSDITHYQIDDHGDVRLATTAPPGAMRAVASLKKKIIHTDHSTVYETEIRLWNKPASLRMGGEHLGLFTGTEQAVPDVHIHIHTARERLTHRLTHLATRHAEEARNGS
jgi:phage terminase small subunit